LGEQGARRAPRIIITSRSQAMIHLDTGFLIRALVRNSPQDIKLRSWLRSNAQLGISSIAWAEFLCGPVDQAEADLAARILPDCKPFTDKDAALAARLFNISGRRRGTFIDCMIAAVAVGADASLATTNPNDFRRLEPAGLQIVTA
jgi:predicted nucleic acid-binding protein